jgi:hypothetical protein
MKIKVLMLMFCMVFIFSMSWAETYKWVDEKGTIHFTQDFGSIPEKFRDQVEIENNNTKDSEEKVDQPYKKESNRPSKGKAREQVKEQSKKSKEEKQLVDIKKIETEVTDTFTTILSLWKEGKYEALYEYGTLSSKANVTKENFVSQMGNKAWGLASSWETLRDIEVNIKHPALVYVSARIGYKPKKWGDTIVRTETYRLLLESGIWRIDLLKVLKAVK